MPSETKEHRQARKQRANLDQVAMRLAKSWPDRWDDPLAVEALRGLVLTQFIDDAHPIDDQGRCARRRCKRWWLFARHRCITRSTLQLCRTTDTVTLWFHVFSRLPDSIISLAEIRTWVAQCQAGKSQTQPLDKDEG